jgi:hypothetical protein
LVVDAVPQATSSVLQTTGRRFIGLLIPNLTAISAGLVALSYGVARPAYDSFYSSLGITPDDIGLSQLQILFRMALNLVREGSFLAGAIVVYLLVRNTTRKVIRQPRPWEPPASGASKLLRRFAPATAGVLMVVAIATAALFTFQSSDRPAVLIGFAVTCGLGICVSPISLSGRARQIAVSLVAALFALASVFFQSYMAGARAKGVEFSHVGSVRGPWGFILTIRYSRVQLVERDGDPDHVCAAPTRYVYLGGNDEHSFVLVRAAKPYVARLSDDDYDLRFVQTYRATSCLVARR